MPNQVLKTEEELPSTRELVEPDTLRITIFPSGVPTFDACLVAEAWPEGSFVEVDVQQHSYQRADVEAFPIATIGFRCLIMNHINLTPGSDIWELHTGDVAVRVAPGTGEDGSDWIFETLAPGTLVRNSNSPSLGCYIIVNETGTTYYTDNGGTGRLAVENSTLFPNFILESPPYQLQLLADFTFLTTNRADIVDPCRKVFFEWSEDGIGWTRLATSYTEAQALSGIISSIPYPPEAVFVRAAWVRGGNNDEQVKSIDVTI